MKQFVLSMEAYDAPLPYPTTANDATVTIDTLENGINHAFESLASLNKLKQSLAKNASKPVNKTQLKIGLLAMEHIKKSTGIYDNGMIVATECFAENISTEGIISGISEIMRNIWDAIKRTFAYIGEMISKFFLGGKRELVTKKGVEKSKEMADEVKDIKESSASTKTVGITTDHSAYSPFLYGDNDGSVKKLHEHLQQAKKSINDTEEMVTAMEVANLNIQESVNVIKKDHNNTSNYNNAFIGAGTYYSTLKTLFAPFPEWQRDKDAIAAAVNVDSSVIDSHSVRQVLGLTAGNKLVFFSRIVDVSTDNEDDSRYRMASLHETSSERRATEIKYDVHLLSGYVDELVKTYELLVQVSKHCEQKSSKMIARQEQMLKDMEASFNLAVGEDEEKARRYLKYFRGVTSSIMQSTKDAVTVIARLDRAVNHHKDLLAVLISNYKKSE